MASPLAEERGTMNTTSSKPFSPLGGGQNERGER